MPQDIALSPPTSSAATKETEPEVVAAISSAEGDPDLPTSFRSGRGSLLFGRPFLILAACAAIGFGLAWLLDRRT